MIEFALSGLDSTIENQPVYVNFSYFDLTKNAIVTDLKNAILKWDTSTKTPQLLIDDEERKLYAIAVMNQSIKVMTDAFATRDIIKARSALNSAQKQIKEIYPICSDKDVNALVSQMMMYVKALDNFEKKKALMK